MAPMAADRSPAHARLITGSAQRFAENWNARSFSFEHALAHNSLFEVASLHEVAARIPKFPGFVHWQNGPIAVSDDWETNTTARLTLDETLAGIESNNSQVILKHAEQDPVVGPPLRQILAEIVDLSPPSMRDDVTIGESIIFVSSPRRVTKYHLDLEANCLLQVSGRKTIHVFDPSVVSDDEIETQCCGNQNAARYRPELQPCAESYELHPGVGVHFPSMAPHWVLNGDEVSVSININFELRSVHGRLRSVHRFNRRLRQLGLNPVSPGQNHALDGAKAALERTLSSARGALSKALDPQAGPHAYPVWRPLRATKADDVFR